LGPPCQNHHDEGPVLHAPFPLGRHPDSHAAPTHFPPLRRSERRPAPPIRQALGLAPTRPA
jgi:hypothetical protein